MVRDVFFNICSRAEISAKKEALVNFLTDSSDGRSTLRPADVLVFRWVREKHACVDLTGVSPPVGLSSQSFTVDFGHPPPPPPPISSHPPSGSGHPISLAHRLSPPNQARLQDLQTPIPRKMLKLHTIAGDQYQFTTENKTVCSHLLHQARKLKDNYTLTSSILQEFQGANKASKGRRIPPEVQG
ncbi:hypothetical protein Tco_1250151, partial [Tanacetum coccineum]